MVEMGVVGQRTSSGLRIEYFADHPDYLPTLGQWFYREWGWFRAEFSENDFTERMRSHLKRILVMARSIFIRLTKSRSIEV